MIRFLVIISFFLIKTNCFSQKKHDLYDFSKNINNSFDLNEELYYKFSYGRSNQKGFLTGGYGSLKVMGVIKKDSLIAYKIEAKGRTTKLFSLFYSVEDFFASYIDTSSLVTHQFIRSVKEGNYEKNQSASFDRRNKTVQTEENIIGITSHTQDALSALYACRTIPNDSIIINDTIFIQIYNLEKKKIFNTYFVPIKKEILNTKNLKKVNTIKCHVHVEKNRIFSEKDATYIWVTDDKRHIPVKVETPIQVGSIYIEMIDAKNINSK